MTMQFLASVRRNQRQWMVVLTILAIFAFLLDDVRGASRMSTGSTVLVFAVLCAGGMSVIGYSRRHTVMYGVVGFLVGGTAAWVGATYRAPKAPVQTTFGALSNEDIARLQTTRNKGQRFLMTLAEKCKLPGGAPMFGGTSIDQIVLLSVYQNEAKRLGVSLSDEEVTKFLKDSMQKKLTQEAYVAALKESGIGESEMFDIIRGELEVLLVGRLLQPPAISHLFMSRLTGTSRVALKSPEALWEDFRKFNVRQELTVVALPVSEFVKPDLIPEPSESELRDYFDKRKDSFGDGRGNAGFKELPKVKLAYLMAADIEAFQKGIPAPTKEEIEEYYNKNKQEFFDFEVPDSPDSGIPDLKGDVDSPADATKPVNVESDGPPPLNSTKTDKPESDKPESDKPPEKKGDEPPKSPDEKPKSDSPCDGDAQSEEDKKSEDKKDESKPDSDKPAEPANEKPAAESDTPPAPAVPKSGESATTPKLTPPSIGLPKFNPHLGPMAPPKLKPLDDELRLEISEKILLKKTFDKLGVVADNAYQYMVSLGLNYQQAEKSERPKLAATFADQLKDYASKNGLEYRETKEMTQRELASSLDEQIGAAGEPGADSFMSRSRQVSEIVFEKDPSGKRSRLDLYSPKRADTPKAKYSYWKLAEIPARTPELADKTTRQLVVDSWKFDKARELAEKRAQELATLVKNGAADVPAALAGQTINGSKESPAVTVREVPKFSWMRLSQSIPAFGSLQLPMESFVDQIDQPGPEFFKLVFDQLNEGDVGVVANMPRTVVYVVRVHNRDGAGPEGAVALQDLQQSFLRERFASIIPTPYELMSAELQQQADRRWNDSFKKHFGITIENESGDEVEVE